MRRTMCMLLALAAMRVSAQVLLNEAGTQDPMTLRFNPAFIQRNGVTVVTGQGILKRDGEPMRNKSEQHLYRFDASGRTTYSNISYGRPGSGRDTAAAMYTYNALGRQTEELRNDLNGWFALRDSLDEAGRTVRRTHVRIQNLGRDRYQLVRGTETIISDERFAHATINDTALKTTWMNDRDLPYREQVFQKDQWGYLRAIDDRNLVTQRRGRITFRYDEKGRLAERIEQPDLTSPETTKHVWRYDNAGNITLCDALRNDRQTRHVEYLYEEGSLLLKAIITKDMETGLIHINRYTTERR